MINTTRLSIPKPEGTDFNTRANYVAAIDAIDANAAKKGDLDTHMQASNPHGTTAADVGAAPSSHVGAGGTAHAEANQTTAGFISATDKTKLDGITSGAEVNQNAFSSVKVGATTIAADTKTDVLELVAGTNVTLTPDAVNDKVTIAATNTTYAEATQAAAGLMSATDKTKVDSVSSGAEVNQNAFSNVKVGTSTIAADTKTDTVELAAGSNITLTADTVNDKVTIAASVPVSSVNNKTGAVSLTAADVGAVSSTDFSTHQAADASLTAKGHVQLSSSTTSIDETMAATPKAVKDVMDKASAAESLANQVQSSLERNVYDDYQLWLELYYKGYISQVEAANAKAIRFDGFLNGSNVNAATTAITNYTSNQVITKGNGTGYDDTWNSDIADDNYAGYGNGQSFKAAGTLTGVKLYIYKIGTPSLSVHLYDITTGTPNIVATKSISNSSIGSNYTWVDVTFTTPINLDPTKTYMIGLLNAASSSNSIKWLGHTSRTFAGGLRCVSTENFTSIQNYYSHYMFIQLVGAEALPFGTSDLISNSKTLPFTSTSAKLYVSAKIPSGTSIAPKYKYSSSYVDMTLNNSRADSKFAGYTEYEYDLDFPSGGTVSQLDITLSGSGGYTPTIKRYGLIIS